VNTTLKIGTQRIHRGGWDLRSNKTSGGLSFRYLLPTEFHSFLAPASESASRMMNAPQMFRLLMLAWS
jgi:hypothetical protein